MGKIKTEEEKKKTRSAAYLRRKYRIENYVGSDKHISNASTGLGVGVGGATFSLTAAPMLGHKIGTLSRMKKDVRGFPALALDPGFQKELIKTKRIAPIKTGLKVAVPAGLIAKVLHAENLKKFHKKKRIRKGWEKTAFVSKPISFMNREELQKKKSSLIREYYQGSMKAPLVGAAVGSTVAVPLHIISKQIKNPATKSFFSKIVIPSAIVGAIAGATTAPKIRKKQVVRDLFRVQNRLKQTDYSRIKKGF